MPKETRTVKHLSKLFLIILTKRANRPKCAAMSDRKSQPQFSQKGLSEADLRRQRQAEALRANLARRKAQVRERRDDAEPPSAGQQPPAQPDEG
jgi:hypothetical protein